MQADDTLRFSFLLAKVNMGDEPDGYLCSMFFLNDFEKIDSTLESRQK